MNEYKKFHHTLDEAFKTPRYANPIERPPSRKYSMRLVVCLVLVYVLAAVVVGMTL